MKDIIYLILMDPCIIDYSVEIPTRCSFVIESTNSLLTVKIPDPVPTQPWQLPVTIWAYKPVAASTV